MAGHNEYLAVQSDNEMPKKNQMAGENLLHLSKTKQSGRPIFSLFQALQGVLRKTFELLGTCPVLNPQFSLLI